MNFTAFKASIKSILDEVSYRSVYKLLYFICLFKYSNRILLQKSFKSASKIATKPKLNFLSSLGYFDFVDDVIKPNKTTYKLVELFKPNDLGLSYNPISILPKLASGQGDINELNNTKVFVQAVNLPDFYALLYPNFDYLEPDALLVRKKGDQYKLEFLEIEAKKPNWRSYLEKKKFNYLKLSRDMIVYDYWAKEASMLKLRTPTVSEFKFCVKFITEIKYDFGNCFIFTKEL